MDFKITLVQSVALLAILILTEPFYRQPLFDASIPIIVDLQAGATPDSIAFWKLVSEIGASYLIVGVLVLSYLLAERSRAFYYKVLFSMIMFVMCIGKLAYHSPRPYMVSDQVQVFGCSTEFGHPSGHSINSMTLCIALLLDYLATYPTAPAENKLIATIVAFATPILVGYSRLFNGDHTMDQILYGWLLGLWIALTCHSLLRDTIFDHVDNLIYKKVAYTQQQMTELFWWAVILFVAALGSMLYVFYVVSSSFIVPQEWQTRLEQKCHLAISFMSFSNASIIEGGTVAMIFGAYQGVLAFAQSPYIFKPADISTVVLRVIVALILMVPYLIPLFVSTDTQNAVVAMIAFTLFPTLGLGNVLYGSLDITYDKWFGTTTSSPSVTRQADPEIRNLVSTQHGTPYIVVIQ